MRSEETLRGILAGNPCDPVALAELGAMAAAASHHPLAHRLRRMAACADPGCAAAWTGLSDSLDGPAALKAAARARAIDPLDAAALVAAARLGAIPIRSAVKRALCLDPAEPDGLHGWSDLRWMEAAVAEAEAWCRRALVAGCRHAEATFQLGTHLMRRGDYAAGMPLLEARFRFRGASDQLDRGAVWRGEPVADKTLLLCGEQGIGDVVQMLRFVPGLRKRGARIGLCVPPAMVSFVRRLAEVDWVVGLGEQIPPYDLHCEMMSLMLRLGLRPTTIPPPPRIAVPPLLAPRDAGGPRRVGIVWGGNAVHQLDRRRSFALGHARAWFDRSGIEWHSLQIGAAGDQIAANGLAPLIVDHRAEVHDVDDLARLIAGLDLVISIDSAPAHLAGVVGVPAWVMLFAPSEWRWGEAVDTPWYPGHRLFRQQTPGDWQPVIAAIGEALDQL